MPDLGGSLLLPHYPSNLSVRLMSAINQDIQRMGKGQCNYIDKEG